MGTNLPELIERCLAGESEAEADLARRFRPWALEVARRVLGDRELAEDAVQEAFLKAFQKLGGLREPNAFPGWMRRVVQTEALRLAKAKEPRAAALEEAPEPSCERDGPRQALEREEERRQVREALRSLPPAEREAAELRYVERLACSQVADILQVPLGTVKRRLHDGRKRMRAMLLGSFPERAAASDRRKKRSLPPL